MSIPSEAELVEMLSEADPDALHAVRNFVVGKVAEGLQPELEAALKANTEEGFSTEYDSVAKCAPPPPQLTVGVAGWERGLASGRLRADCRRRGPAAPSPARRA